jgi:hypothetical protein
MANAEKIWDKIGVAVMFLIANRLQFTKWALDCKFNFGNFFIVRSSANVDGRAAECAGVPNRGRASRFRRLTIQSA